jgi:hypothetical protein
MSLNISTAVGQNISLSYEKNLTDIEYLGGTYDVIGGQPREAIIHTSSGYSLYYGEEKTGLDNFIKLRNNNTIIWQTQVDNYPDNITPYQFYEHESGYFFVGDFALSSQTGGIAKLNKTTGSFEVKRKFTDISNPGTFAINGTHGGNIIVGGSTDIGSGSSNRKAMIRVVNLLGDALATRTSNNLGGLWGNVVSQIEKTNDSGYIISGFVYENTICGEPNNTSWWICKLNSNLEVVWSQKYGNGNGTVSPNKIKVLPNNEIVAIGTTYCTNGNGGGINNMGEGTWLAKLNASGGIIFNEFIGVNMIDYTKAYSDIDHSCDQNLLLAGSSGSLLGSSYFVEKFDYNLNLIEGSTVYFDPVTNYNYQKIGIRSGTDKSYLLFGYKDFGTSNNSYSFVAKTLPDPACGSNPNPLLCELNLGHYSICEDFDKLQVGNIDPQGSPKLTLFSGSATQNALVTTEKSNSGTKSLKFTNTSDIDFNIDRAIESPSRLEWMTYMDGNKTGSWGLETNDPSYYSMITRLDNGNGTVLIFNTSNQLDTKATFTFPKGQWFKTALIFDPNAQTIEVWINNQFIYSRPNYVSAKVTDLNIYGTPNLSNNLFYIDDLLYYETKIPCLCSEEFDPVCINGQEYSNKCKAACGGYSQAEWSVGPCGSTATSLTFDIDDNLCASVGTTAKIPIRVKDFINVSSFQYSLKLNESSKGEIVSLEKGNLAGELNYGLISPSVATVVWDNLSPVSLSDGDIVLYVNVKIKTNFAGNSVIEITNTPSELSAQQNQITVIPQVMPGSFCARNNTFSICGKVLREDNVPLPNVEVKLSGFKTATATTNENGLYCFDLLEGNQNYTITPFKNTDHKNGINGGDVTAIRKHILALEKLNSPYKIIAADVNKSSTVNSGDVTEIRKLILALINQFSSNTSWLFVPKTHSFSNPQNPFNSSFPTSISFNSLNTDQMTTDFVGIKIGDVNLTNTPSNIQESTESRSLNEITIILGSATVSSNQQFDIPISVRQFNDILNGQFSINWNPNLAQFVSLQNLNSTLGLTSDNFNQTLTGQGKLGFLWDSPSPVNLPDNTILFTLRFNSNGNGMSTITINEDPVQMYFENVDNQSLQINVINGNLTVPTLENYSSSINIYPNPSSGQIYIDAGSQIIQSVAIFDTRGNRMKYFEHYINGTLNISDLNSGVYSVQIQSDHATFSKKIVLIK